MFYLFISSMLNLFSTISVQGREPCLGQLVNVSLALVCVQGFYEIVSFKLGMVMDMTKVNIVVPV